MTESNTDSTTKTTVAPESISEPIQPIITPSVEPSVEALESSPAEVLPPILRPVANTLNHVFSDQLAYQIRDLAGLGLSKSSVAMASRVTMYILEKYYLDYFLEGQANMQKGLARVAVDEAMNGNTPVLLHLLKTKLGWSEQHQLEISGEVRSVVSAQPLTKEQFIQKYIENKDD